MKEEDKLSRDELSTLQKLTTLLEGYYYLRSPEGEVLAVSPSLERLFQGRQLTGRPCYHAFADLLGDCSHSCPINRLDSRIVCVKFPRYLYPPSLPPRRVIASARPLYSDCDYSGGQLLAFLIHLPETGLPLPVEMPSSGYSLTHSDQFLRALTNSTECGLAFVRHRTILWVNRGIGRILGYQPEELIGQNTRFLYHSDEEYAAAGRLVYDYIQKSGYYLGELDFIHKKGHRVPCLVSANPLYPPRPHLGVIYSVMDLTEIKKAQELLRQKEREEQQREKLHLLGYMAAGLAHELRNPLTSIQGFAQVLLLKVSDPALKEYLNLILSEAAQANRIITDFLTYTRPAPPRAERFVLQHLLQDLTRLIQPSAREHNAALHCHWPSEAIFLTGDRQQLQQVFLNLAQNALQAMQGCPQRCLKFTVVPDYRNGEIKILVSDTGRGIAPEHLPQLGTPFFTTRAEGTGLGLSIAYRIVESHGGRIEVVSRLGEGSTFTVILPLNNTENHLSSPEGKETERLPPGS